jgi:mannose-6-phosphate isomerase-like protein (cupin superfamily)
MQVHRLIFSAALLAPTQARYICDLSDCTRGSCKNGAHLRLRTLLTSTLFVSTLAFAQDPPADRTADGQETANSRAAAEGEAVTFVSAQQLLSRIRGVSPQIPGFSWLTYMKTNASNVEVVRRTLPGKAELHKAAVDIWHVIHGSGTLVTGGTLHGKIENFPREVNWDTSSDGPSELRGAGITGGEERHVAKGDFVVIPAGTPHSLRRIDGEIVYLIIKVPPANAAPRSHSGAALTAPKARVH